MWSVYWSILPSFFILGWLADRWFGDPTNYHPIVLFGKLISWGEVRFNKGTNGNKRRLSIIYNSLIILLPITLYILIYFLTFYVGYNISSSFLACCIVFILVSNLLVFYMLSGTTLIREVQQVFISVEQSIELGRKQVGRIVGRDTQRLSEEEIKTAALETLSENLSDGVIAPLFWFLCLGVPGILMYKMVNTQDSMIGYKNERYLVYGRFSARLDDLLNYIPARLTALLMLLSVGRLDLLPFVKKYGRAHASPNSGYPEAALAGILNCRFGGPHDYFGEVVDKPYIGVNNRTLSLEDLELAIKINRRVEYMMVALIIVFSLSFYFLI